MSIPLSDEEAGIESERLPEFVRSRVAYARRGLASARILQSFCCGVAAATLSLAAATHVGGELGERDVQVVALVNGLLAWIASALAYRRAPREVARQIDAALDLHGALFTAWEAEGVDRPSRLARLLGRDVASRVSAKDMVHAVLPNMVVSLALPFLASALLFSAMENARSAPDVRDLAALTRQVEQGLASLSEEGTAGAAGAPGVLDLEEQKELRRLMGKAAELTERVREGQAGPEELAALGDELAALRAELGGAENLRRGLEDTMNSVDAARMALEGRRSKTSDTEAGQGSGGEGMSGSGGRSLAPGREDGRMVRPELQTTAPGNPTGSEREQAGVLGHQAWPEAHENIIRRWVESARQSRPPR